MTLHLFYPGHDLALAHGTSNYTLPRAAVRLQNDCAFLMAAFAKEGDFVLTPDKDYARQCMHQWGYYLPHVELVSWEDDLAKLPITAVHPWGWNAALCAELQRHGLPRHLLPTAETLQHYRNLSHRRTAMHLLPALRKALSGVNTVGEAVCVSSIGKCVGTHASQRAACETVEAYLKQWGGAMLKAPWSSSGRGVVPVYGANLDDKTRRWVVNTLQQQGSVMMEPIYIRVYDFAMEFTIGIDGAVNYEGLSLFHTAATQYTGNVIAPEAEKRRLLSRWITSSQLDEVREALLRLLAEQLSAHYQGRLGVDMMIVASHGNCRNVGGSPASELPQTKTDATPMALHPCVEINLRCTMGHVALALSKRNPALKAMMQMEYDGRFHMHLQVS